MRVCVCVMGRRGGTFLVGVYSLIQKSCAALTLTFHASFKVSLFEMFVTIQLATPNDDVVQDTHCILIFNNSTLS